jgi:hypothetical protein
MSNVTLQAPINLSESVDNNEINTSNRYYIPVVGKVLNRVLKAMRLAGVEWDSTVNQIDAFMLTNPAIYWDWRNLTPRKSGKDVVYILYVD